MELWYKNAYTNPNFVKGSFVALGETVLFQPWDQVFNFSFLRFGRFCKKKLGRHVKKFSPSPLWGHRLPVTALALLASRPDASNVITFGLAINQIY